MKKKIGIVVDNYKVMAYERVLKQNGYETTTTRMPPDKYMERRLSAITFFVDEKDFVFATLETNEICKQLESDFKAGRN